MWDWFINFLYAILEGLAGFCGDWGVAVIVLTIIIRIIIMPLMTKSTASSAKMQALQPMMQEIQQRYANDPERQAKEMQKFYADNKFNPLGGCLPMIVQMPVFFGLFSVAKMVPKGEGFLNIVPELSESVSNMIHTTGLAGGAVYILLVVAFGVLTLIPMLMSAKNMPPEQRQSSLFMGIAMAVMMVWVGWKLPAAVILYYDASAIWQVVQQKVVTQRVMDKVKAETEAKLAEQGVDSKIEVVRREKKARPRKKG